MEIRREPLQCEVFDRLLHGGFEAGAITELFGEGGAGKTNICLQLCRNVAREGRKVVYIDTEGVSLERLKQITGSDFEEVLQNILFFKAHSLDEQENAVDKAITLAESKVGVSLIVLDSATIHYRVERGVGDEVSGRRSLAYQLTKLLKIARKRHIPVVLTNQVYTNLDKGTFEPIGGHTLHHCAKTIIKLEKLPEPGKRRAIIVKHRSSREAEHCDFTITEKGVE